MDTIQTRSIVVGTDLGESSDRLVRVAAALAELTGADLHLVLVHTVAAAPPPQGSSEAESEAAAIRLAEARLDEQVQRALPPQVTPSSRMVLARSSPSEGIRRHAEELSSDLIVIGPHRGREAERPFLGTTADRLVSTAGTPCLIVRDGPDFPIRKIGVLVDFSPAAQGALDAATAWMLAFSGGDADEHPPVIAVAHVAWSPRDAPASTGSVARLLPELGRTVQRTRQRMNIGAEVEYQPEVLLAGEATEVVAGWVRDRQISLLVMGTRGTSRLPYAYLGGLASALARSAPCSILFVPPEYAPEGLRAGGPDRVRIRRIVTGVDFHESSWDAALWVMRYLAPEAEHELIHVVELPDLPGPLRGFGGKREQLRLAARTSAATRLRELCDLGGSPAVASHVQPGRPATELLRLAEEVDADLIVVGEQGPTHGIASLLGSTAERVLSESTIPVLVARDPADSPPRSLLVAVDDSDPLELVLAWAAELVERYDAGATVLNVVDRLLLADDLTGMPDVEEFRTLEGEAVAAMRTWLRVQTDGAGLPVGRVQTKVAVGDPSYEIIAEAQRTGAELVLLGSRRGAVAKTPLIGRIVNKVVRSAPSSVLVIPSRSEPP